MHSISVILAVSGLSAVLLAPLSSAQFTYDLIDPTPSCYDAGLCSEYGAPGSYSAIHPNSEEKTTRTLINLARMYPNDFIASPYGIKKFGKTGPAYTYDTNGYCGQAAGVPFWWLSSVNQVARFSEWDCYNCDGTCGHSTCDNPYRCDLFGDDCGFGARGDAFTVDDYNDYGVFVSAEGLCGANQCFASGHCSAMFDPNTRIFGVGFWPLRNGNTLNYVSGYDEASILPLVSYPIPNVCHFDEYVKLHGDYRNSEGKLLSFMLQWFDEVNQANQVWVVYDAGMISMTLTYGDSNSGFWIVNDDIPDHCRAYYFIVETTGGDYYRMPENERYMYGTAWTEWSWWSPTYDCKENHYYLLDDGTTWVANGGPGTGITSDSGCSGCLDAYIIDLFWYTYVGVAGGTTDSPTLMPSDRPTNNSSPRPTANPTPIPTNRPTYAPTPRPTIQPSSSPIDQPTPSPTDKPSNRPTNQPSNRPTVTPTDPTNAPSDRPTNKPTDRPTGQPTDKPTYNPTPRPSAQPTDAPTNPTVSPTVPTTNPTDSPVVSNGGSTTSEFSSNPIILERKNPSGNSNCKLEIENLNYPPWDATNMRLRSTGSGEDWKECVTPNKYGNIYRCSGISGSLPYDIEIVAQNDDTGEIMTLTTQDVITDMVQYNTYDFKRNFPDTGAITENENNVNNSGLDTVYIVAIGIASLLAIVFIAIGVGIFCKRKKNNGNGNNDEKSNVENDMANAMAFGVSTGNGVSNINATVFGPTEFARPGGKETDAMSPQTAQFQTTNVVAMAPDSDDSDENENENENENDKNNNGNDNEVNDNPFETHFHPSPSKSKSQNKSNGKPDNIKLEESITIGFTQMAQHAKQVEQFETIAEIGTPTKTSKSRMKMKMGGVSPILTGDALSPISKVARRVTGKTPSKTEDPGTPFTPLVNKSDDSDSQQEITYGVKKCLDSSDDEE